MSSHRYGSFILLSAFFVLIGFFFPLYSSYLLSPDLARGPIDQSVGATSHFLMLLRDPQFQRQVQSVSLLIPFFCFLFYWLLLLLSLLSFSFSIWALRSSSSAARTWLIRFTILGLIALVLLLVSHTFFFVEFMLAFTQRKTIAFWDLLLAAGTPFFWRTLFLFCTSSFFGIWFPLLGFLSILCLNGFLNHSTGRRLPSNR